MKPNPAPIPVPPIPLPPAPAPTPIPTPAPTPVPDPNIVPIPFGPPTMPPFPLPTNVPAQHPRIYWGNAARLAQARANYTGVTLDTSDPWSCLAAYSLSTDSSVIAQAGQALLNGAPRFAGLIAAIDQIFNDQVQDPNDPCRYTWWSCHAGCDSCRYGDWIPLAWDALQTLSLSQWPQTSRDDTRNKYTQIVQGCQQQTWGGPAEPSSNYYWGDFRNEVNWALAIWTEDQTNAQAIMDFALNQRFSNSNPDFSFFNVIAPSNGTQEEGPRYGLYNLSYPQVPLFTLQDYGVDLFAATTNFWKATGWHLLHWCSMEPVLHKQGTSYPQLFCWGDVQNNQDLGDQVYVSASQSWLPDVMVALQTLYPATNVGKAATWFLQQTGGYPSLYLTIAQNPATLPPPLDPVAANLPLDFSDPYTGWMYCRSSWTPGHHTHVLWQGGTSGGGHGHNDLDTIQVIHKGEYLIRENTGYYADSNYLFTSGDARESANHNPVLFAGAGYSATVRYDWANLGITRQQSSPGFALQTIRLTGAYTADNPSAVAHVRDKIFLRSIGHGDDTAMVIVDRLQASDPSVPRTVLWHTPEQPNAASGNAIVQPNTLREMKSYVFLPSPTQPGVFRTPAWDLIDEGTASNYAAGTDTYGWTVRATDTPNAAVSYAITVHHFREAGSADVAVSVTLSADHSQWTIVVGNQTIVLNTGLTPTGGSVNSATIDDGNHSAVVAADGSGYSWN